MNMILMALGVPVLIYLVYLTFTKPWTGFTLVIALNYFIMGINRYISIPIPISVLIELVHISFLISLIAKKDTFLEEGKIPYSLISIYGVWTLFCCLEIINDSCNLGLDVVAWFKDVRFYAFDPIICILVVSMIICKKHDTEKFMIIVGCLLILAAIKCFCQKTFGFDIGEKEWLASRGARTHILNAGTLIRYFSFFTDAANFGCHTAYMAVVFGIHMLYTPTKRKFLKLFYCLVTGGCVYGMFLSGARSALFVFIGTIIAYIFLSRNWKMFSLSLAGLIILLGVLMFTDRGNGIQAVRRMRTAFNLEKDASVAVRDTNKDAIAKYLSEAPLGVGLGRSIDNVPEYSRYRVVVSTPPDSTLVHLWVMTGAVGITIFCFVSIVILFKCSTIVWFRINDPGLRTRCATFTAGGAGWFFAGYTNEVYFQYPNTLIVFGLITIVFMAPYIERKEQEELEKAKQLARISSDTTEN